MIATIVNTLAVIVGSLIGLALRRGIRDGVREAVYIGIGVVSLIIGISMALSATRVLYLALSLVIGGVVGELMGIEAGILRLGEFLRRRFTRGDADNQFAYGFLTASVLFCVGALAIVGSFRAGAEGNYELILTKSVMDGFMSILLAGAMGIGVAFSALTVLLYQGALTLGAVALRPLVSPLVLSEVTGVGGAMVMMIGINLLGLKKIQTGNFFPSLVVVLVFVALDPWLGPLSGM
ncbi:MAG: DUF554 domain-containing protein [Spirochaetaceae bacterium]|nr:MAG: DUF554 domain-containing protein [Spirochaetaceae bacterium]